ncbi:MAG: hypothetical protein QXF76_03445 [Candidatus Anstonellales archaeon]
MTKKNHTEIVRLLLNHPIRNEGDDNKLKTSTKGYGRVKQKY